MKSLLAGKYDVDSETGCWIWNRARNAHGYGALGHQGKVLRAHRVSYEAFVGPVMAGVCVLHRCDRPACINPDHLFIGSKADNSADMVRKGRSAAGEHHSQAKLTAIQVIEIRRMAAVGDLTTEEIGARFGIRGPAVSRIVRGLRWGRLAS